MRQTLAVIWLLVLFWCGCLTPTAHSVVPLPTSKSEQRRTLLQTSPATNKTTCLDRQLQWIKARRFNRTKPAVAECTAAERAAEQAAKDAEKAALALQAQQIRSELDADLARNAQDLQRAQNETREMEMMTKRVEASLNKTLQANRDSKNSAPSPHVSVRSILFCALVGLAVMILWC